MKAHRRSTRALSNFCIAALLFAAATIAAEPPSPDQARIHELEKQVDDLSQELSRLKGANDPAAQRQAMQRHWSMMQQHMQSVRQMPGVGARGCTDWMMMDPSVMGPGGNGGCGMTGHGMMGQGMGPGMMGWGMPSALTAGSYQQQMQGHMQRMHEQMAAIAAEKDPTKRQALMRSHYESMYRQMQTMRGMGWMWAPNAAASLPDAKSRGGQLVTEYCSQCHAPPAPSLHTKDEWGQVTSRMREHIDERAAGAGPGVKVPSASELDAIDEYLGKHARER